MAVEFPNDVNGDVLRRMEAHGDVLSEPRNINFHLVFPTRSQAIGFIEVIPDKDLQLQLIWYAENKCWECTVVKYTVPTHRNITALEDRLTALAHPLKGTPDGWGCLQIDR